VFCLYEIESKEDEIINGYDGSDDYEVSQLVGFEKFNQMVSVASTVLMRSSREEVEVEHREEKV
jgi:hypothetical protein